MNEDISAYHDKQEHSDRLICDQLYDIIDENLPQADSKLWHAHPVWFIEPGLKPTGTFKAAEIVFTDAGRIDEAELQRYLKKAVRIQWDYKNIIKNKGLLELKK